MQCIWIDHEQERGQIAHCSRQMGVATRSTYIQNSYASPSASFSVSAATPPLACRFALYSKLTHAQFQLLREIRPGCQPPDHGCEIDI